MSLPPSKRRLLFLALLICASTSCHLIFTYEGREPADGAAPSPEQELGAIKDGPDALDNALVDAVAMDKTPDGPMGDRGQPDNSAKDKGSPDKQIKDKGQPDKPQKLDKGCPLGTTPCGGVCVDLLVSTKHCGMCNNACPTSTTDRCLAGNCSCGAVGAGCVGGLNCKAAKCACITGGLCKGCCDGNTCRTLGASQSLGKCGQGGAACKSCDDGNDCTDDGCSASGACTKSTKSTGTSCNSGKGKCAAGSCCQGCLQGTVCKGGSSTSLCGQGGVVCKSCDDGNDCTDDGCSASGACTKSTKSTGTSCNSGKGKCAAGSCCQGCLQGTVCKGGSSTSSCGVGGEVCKSCPGATCQSSSCTSSGSCVKISANNGTSCNSGKGQCAGGSCCEDCRQGNICNLGTSHYICGKGGIVCQNCSLNATLKLCTSQVCSVGQTCGSVNCLGGCCNGNTCVLTSAQNPSTCGKNGVICSACPAGQFCKNGSCVW